MSAGGGGGGGVTGTHCFDGLHIVKIIILG